jgi:hypothetical protein
VIGIIEYDLADSAFVKNPRKEQQLTLDFLHPPSLKKMKRIVKKRSEESRAKAKASGQTPEKLQSMGTDSQGRKQYKIPDAPKELEAQEEGKKNKVLTLDPDIQALNPECEYQIPRVRSSTRFRSFPRNRRLRSRARRTRFSSWTLIFEPPINVGLGPVSNDLAPTNWSGARQKAPRTRNKISSFCFSS